MLQILSDHDEALCSLGVPIKIGNIDLTDRKCNYINDFDSMVNL